MANKLKFGMKVRALPRSVFYGNRISAEGAEGIVIMINFTQNTDPNGDILSVLRMKKKKEQEQTQDQGGNPLSKIGEMAMSLFSKKGS